MPTFKQTDGEINVGTCILAPHTYTRTLKMLNLLKSMKSTNKYSNIVCIFLSLLYFFLIKTENTQEIISIETAVANKIQANQI